MRRVMSIMNNVVNTNYNGIVMNCQLMIVSSKQIHYMIQNIFCLIFDNLVSRICAENVECAKLRRDAEFQSKKKQLNSMSRIVVSALIIRAISFAFEKHKRS